MVVYYMQNRGKNSLHQLFTGALRLPIVLSNNDLILFDTPL